MYEINIFVSLADAQGSSGGNLGLPYLFGWLVGHCTLEEGCD